jgi:hypothetical protein
MRVSTTIALAVIAICLGIATAVVDRKEEVDSASAANVLVRFSQEDVSRVVIEKGPSRTVIQRNGTQWFFSEPEQDRVDAGVVKALLDELNHLTVLDVMGEDESQTPTQMGVEGDQAIRISVSGKPEKGDPIKEEFVLGGEAPRANSIYASEGERTVVVDGNPRPWVEQPLTTLRDQRLISAPVETIVQLGIKRSTGELAVQRKLTPPQQNWALIEPVQVWASPAKLDELLAELANLKITEVVSDVPSGEEIPNPLPDDAAVLQIRVFGIEKPLTVYLKQIEAPPVEGAPAMIEARVSDRPSVYRFPSTILTKLPAEADELRDRTLARIPEQFLESIWIQSRIDPDVILRSAPTNEGLRWDVSMNNKLIPANGSQVSELVAGVNEAVIQDFASDLGTDMAGFGLLPPARKITFNLKFPGPPNPDGSAGPQQTMQRVLNLGWKDGDEQRLFANFEGEPYVYELDPSFVSLFPTHPLKWRSLNVLTFHKIHLESITREIAGAEKLKLDYQYQTDTWTANRNGMAVPTLDRAAANRLQERLGSLSCNGWYLSAANAHRALQTPGVTFSIVTKELDPARGEAVRKTHRIILAGTGGDLYYGQLEGSPDVFILSHEKYRDLIRPVTTSRAAQ